MQVKPVKKTIHAQGIEIGVYTTDFLGLWETLHNPELNLPMLSETKDGAE